jgi:membrane protein DedA with SNARE-associated domain
MPRAPFQIANWASAFVWAGAMLAPGAFGLSQLRSWLEW